MSIETIGPIMMIVMLLVFLIVVALGLNGGKGKSENGGARPRRSPE